MRQLPQQALMLHLTYRWILAFNCPCEVAAGWDWSSLPWDRLWRHLRQTPEWRYRCHGRSPGCRPTPRPVAGCPL